MADNVYRDETGQLYQRRPGLGDQPISEETAQQADKGFLGSVAGEFADTLQDSFGGMVEAGGGAGIGGILNPAGYILDRFDLNPTSKQGREIQAQNDARQKAREIANPGGSITGFGLGVAADLALPMPPLASGARAARAAGGGASRGAAIGETIVNLSQSKAGNIARAGGDMALGLAEKAPFGIGTGVKAIREGVTDTGQRMARQSAARGSLSAAKVPGEGVRFKTDTMPVDDALAYMGREDINVPESMRLVVDAPDAQGVRLGQEQVAGDIFRERGEPGALERGIFGDRPNISSTQADLQEGLNVATLKEIGVEDPTGRISAAVVRDRMDEIGKGLNEIADKAGPMDAKGLLDELDEVAGELASEDVQSVNRRLKALIDAKSAGGTQPIAPADHAIIRNRINDRLKTAAKNNADPEVADYLEGVSARVMDRLSATLDDADLDLDRKLRKQWGLSRALTDRARAIGEFGVNPNTLINSMASKRGAGKAGVVTRDEFGRFLATMDDLLKKPPRSGTDEGLGAFRRRPPPRED